MYNADLTNEHAHNLNALLYDWMSLHVMRTHSIYSIRFYDDALKLNKSLNRIESMESKTGGYNTPYNSLSDTSKSRPWWMSIRYAI
jgi:hypothetical protein